MDNIQQTLLYSSSYFNWELLFWLRRTREQDHLFLALFRSFQNDNLAKSELNQQILFWVTCNSFISSRYYDSQNYVLYFCISFRQQFLNYLAGPT